MSSSLIEKTPLVIVRNTSGGTLTAGAAGRITFPVDRNGLISEIAISLNAQAAFAVAPVAGEQDVRRFIDRINIRTSDGDIINSLTGPQIYDLARLYEDPSVPVLTPGAGGGAVGSIEYGNEVHFEMDGAYFDLATAIKGQDVSKLDVEIIIASEATCEYAFGATATFAAVPAFQITADVEIYQYPAMVTRADVGYQVQYAVNKTDAAAAGVSGRRYLQLDPSNLMRGLMMHVDDVTTATDPVGDDTIVGNVVLMQGNRVLRETNWTAMRQATERKQGLDVPGMALLSWGDQTTGFAPLTQEPVQIGYDINVAGPAFQINVCQNYIKDRMV